ncbi:thiosulfohydrolase SoxB [Notoacmeibacter marinus]|uniref:thiosulfohydrolase SoxB n=1 Tax=Notoacmeibacter marinus TaxID=1876515 RepID=UPI000DF47FFA|nr:thiosulfohydrolase SoxB [Notoacmeibacter marinus]
MFTRREFLQWSAVAAGTIGFSSNVTRLAAQQQLTQDDLLAFDSTGDLTILHVTDIHAQLKPIYFRPPSENIGVGMFEGVPPHLVGEAFLQHFGLTPGSALAHAHTMVDYVNLAKAYGRMGGLDRIATVVNAVRAERGDGNVLLLDGGDTWQGSYTSLQTKGQDMVDAMALLKPDAMVGHWEFTYGEDRVLELIDALQYPFLSANVFDTTWDEPVFDAAMMREVAGHKVAVIGQSMPYTPIANPRWMIPNWSFGIRPEVIAAQVEKARADGAEVVILLSHNGFDVDQKLARDVPDIDVILTGHTHDAIPRAIEIGKTLLLASGSHGKFVGRVDLDIRDGKVTAHQSKTIPIFADVIAPDPAMAAKIDEIRAPFEDELNRVIGQADDLLYRRGNFNGTWDDVICQGMIEERDAQLSFSPGFRWGATLLPGQDITIDDLHNQTSMTYPSVYRLEFSGLQIKEIMEDVCDNLFNKDPYFQQGGDMVRVGGMAYTCAPKETMGNRISDMTMTATGKPIDMDRSYVVAGWASVNENVEGPAIWDVMESYITRKQTVTASGSDIVKVVGI